MIIKIFGESVSKYAISRIYEVKGVVRILLLDGYVIEVEGKTVNEVRVEVNGRMNSSDEDLPRGYSTPYPTGY